MGNCAGQHAPHLPEGRKRTVSCPEAVLPLSPGAPPPARVASSPAPCGRIRLELSAAGGEAVATEVHTIKLAQVIPTYRGGLCALYQLDPTKLGAGTYGTVCRGVHSRTGAARAIKAVKHHGTRSVRALQSEIATLQAMDHPNVIKLFEAYEDHKASYLVMELCEGGELLDRIIAAKFFSESQAAIVMTQILKAVRYVHDKDIAHRDLKPQNFLLLNKEKLENNTLKLIDFGFACSCKPGTVLRTCAGTALYVAPQVLQGKYDKQCDMWSVGVTLYALLSGKPPFAGGSDKEIFEKVRKGRVNLQGNTWRRVSSDAKDLIRELLKMSPRERLTAEKALRHDWITQQMPAAQTASLDAHLVERLRSFRVRNKLERAVLKIVARDLSDDKVKDLRAAFEALDANGDGKLSMEELSGGLARAGFERHGLDLHCMMAMADADGNGEIDYSEFLHATLDRRRYLTDEALLAAFRVFDRNGDGGICREELKHVLCSCSHDMDGCCQRVLELLNDIDVSGDGLVDFGEFKDMMHSWDKSPSTTSSPPLKASTRPLPVAAFGGA